MNLLAGKLYDPSTAASVATSALLAMTAIDTTNLRLTFTVPNNGAVLVRLQGSTTGATSSPRIFLGVLEGGTVRARMTPMGGSVGAAIATDYMPAEAVCVVGGLTPGASLTWDAAYGVEVLVASSVLKWGGPDNASGANAWGGFAFEIYDTIGLIASTLYDPTSAAGGATTLKAMTAIDTTNLRLTFKAPSSGKVCWRLRVPWIRDGGATWGQPFLGVLEGAAVRARQAPQRSLPQVNGATTAMCAEAGGIVSGLTPGASLTWDAAFAVQVINAGTNIIKWGGPNNTVTNDAWGGVGFEVWAA